MQEQRHRQTESVQTHYQPEVRIGRELQVSRPGGPSLHLVRSTLEGVVAGNPAKRNHSSRWYGN